MNKQTFLSLSLLPNPLRLPNTIRRESFRCFGIRLYRAEGVMVRYTPSLGHRQKLTACPLNDPVRRSSLSIMVSSNVSMFDRIGCAWGQYLKFRLNFNQNQDKIFPSAHLAIVSESSKSTVSCSSDKEHSGYETHWDQCFESCVWARGARKQYVRQ